jgi:hypothetical protein
MKGQFVKSNVSDLPKWAKGIIAIAIVGGVGYIAYKIYQSIKKVGDEKDVNKVLISTDKELNDLLKSGAKPSFPTSNYYTASNTIKQLLDGCDTSQNELAATYEVVKVVKSRIDWLMLVKAFGKRLIDNCGIGTGDTLYDLPTLLKDQLGQAQLYYKLDTPHYKDSGGVTATYNIIEKYFNKIGITL